MPRNKENIRKGKDYEVGNNLEYGTIKAIWPTYKGNRFLLVHNKDGTYTFYTIPLKHYVGVTVARFLPYSILEEAVSIISGKDLKSKVKAPKPSPKQKTINVPGVGNVLRRRRNKDG